MLKLDKKDKKILFELEMNARQGYNEIARKVGLSRDVVTYRISQMEKNGVIKGYFTLIDPSKFGYILVRVYLKLKNTTPAIEGKIIDFFMKDKNTLTVYKTELRWDVALGFLVRDVRHFREIYKQFEEKYKKYILESKISVIYEFVHFYRNYLVDKAHRDYTPMITGKAEKIEIDETDIRLLDTIAANARMPLIEIAKNLELTSMAVKYRMKQLEKNKVILGYRPMINFSLFGYEYYKVDLYIEDMKILSTLEEFVKQNSNVTFIDRTIGGSDFEFDIEIESLGELYALIEKIKARFPGILRTYEFYKAKEILKYVYMPKLPTGY